MGAIKDRLGLLALLIASLGLGLLIQEVMVRLWFEGKYAQRPGVYVADPECTWKPAANLSHTFHGDDFSMRIETDRHGYRLGRLGRVEEGARVVVLSGDSHTFGWGVSTEQTLASVLDELLHASSGRRVVNLGVGGYGTLQSARRLAQFVQNRPDVRIEAVVFIHSHNDMSDNANLRNLAVMLGYRQSQNRLSENGNRSRSHLVNLVRRVAASLGQPLPRRPEVGRVDDRVRDVLWAFQVLPMDRPMPAAFQLGATTFRTADFSEEDSDPSVAMEREALTPLQGQLMEESIDALHGAMGDRRVPVHHTFIYTAPDWYLEALKTVIQKAGSHGNRIHFAGRMPRPESHRGPIWNDHSGGHYTPVLNRAWAEALHEMLR